MDPVQYLLLIGELEGCSAQMKVLGQPEDRAILKEMLTKYYKLYFKCKKEWPKQT